MNDVRWRDFSRHLAAWQIVQRLLPALLELIVAAVFVGLVLFEPAIAVRYWTPFAAAMFVLAYVNLMRAMDQRRGRRQR